MKNIFKALFLVIGLACIGFIVYQQIQTPKTPGKIFSSKFESDMEDLQQNGYLPKTWESLKEVKFVATSPGAEKWLAESKPVIKTKTDGKYILEYVLIDDSEQDKQLTIALVQMSITEIETGNKIWELARFYSLNDDDSDDKVD